MLEACNTPSIFDSLDFQVRVFSFCPRSRSFPRQPHAIALHEVNLFNLSSDSADATCLAVSCDGKVRKAEKCPKCGLERPKNRAGLGMAKRQVELAPVWLFQNRYHHSGHAWRLRHRRVSRHWRPFRDGHFLLPSVGKTCRISCQVAQPPGSDGTGKQRDLAREISTSVLEFPTRLATTVEARHMALKDGPFPVCLTDLTHSNIVVDKNYDVIGIIDLEGARTLPWELIEYPPFLDTLPQPLSTPDKYDEKGEPLDLDTRRCWQDRNAYLDMATLSEHTDD
ncbi:hypothetical protein DL770_007308 [Monosporascus sp. CRB-9-2]|nr:hypothetical protein DL770_007308 [Monosporascus sp. CRB-9-2]